MTHTKISRRRQKSPKASTKAIGKKADGKAMKERSAAQRPDPIRRFEICVGDRCPIEDTLDVLAGRWKILILWWLQAGELRFGELRRRVPSVTPKMLTQQLRQMEDDGLIRREVFAEVPPKVVYTMTKRGLSLQPVLLSLHDWSVAQTAK